MILKFRKWLKRKKTCICLGIYKARSDLGNLKQIMVSFSIISKLRNIITVCLTCFQNCENLFSNTAIIGSVYIYLLDGKEISVELETLLFTDYFQNIWFYVILCLQLFITLHPVNTFVFICKCIPSINISLITLSTTFMGSMV